MLYEVITRWDVEPILSSGLAAQDGGHHDNVNPGRLTDVIGKVRLTSLEELEQAVADACAFSAEWDLTPGAERAAILEKAADLMEDNAAEFMALCAREAGKTVPDAVAERNNFV